MLQGLRMTLILSTQARVLASPSHRWSPPSRSPPLSHSSPPAPARWVCLAGAEKRNRQHWPRNENTNCNFGETAARRSLCLIVRCPLFGPKRTSASALHMSAFGGKADMALGRCLLLRSLLGAKRTWVGALHMSAFDPKRTSSPLLRPNLRVTERKT